MEILPLAFKLSYFIHKVVFSSFAVVDVEGERDGNYI